MFRFPVMLLKGQHGSTPSLSSSSPPPLTLENAALMGATSDHADEGKTPGMAGGLDSFAEHSWPATQTSIKK